MASELTKESEEIIKEIAKKEGFDNYELKISAGSEKGDNYLGIITAVDIIEKNTDKTLSLILKSASKNEEFRKLTPITKAYEREVYMYDTIFKEFDKLQDEHNVKNKFLSHARFYGYSLTDNDEFLILGNLKTVGYQLWPRHKPMNIEHIEFVFKEYGKYHALAMALRTLKPETYNSIFNTIYENIFKTNKEDMVKKNNMVLKNGFEACKNNEKATDALKKGRLIIDEIFEQDDTFRHPHEIIKHGDCWCNNMLFKYHDQENTTKPSSMCFLDFQVIQTGLAVQDLSYFLFANTTRDVYSNDQKFLKIYYDSFSQMLTELGCDPAKIFTYEDLLKQWKTKCMFGVYVSMAILKVILSDAEKTPDLQSAAESGEDIIQMFSKEFGTNEEYSKRICDMLEFLSDRNYV